MVKADSFLGRVALAARPGQPLVRLTVSHRLAQVLVAAGARRAASDDEMRVSYLGAAEQPAPDVSASAEPHPGASDEPTSKRGDPTGSEAAEQIGVAAARDLPQNVGERILRDLEPPAMQRSSKAAATTAEQDAAAVDVAELVRRAAEGDQWAWERLMDQYSRLIWATTRDFKLSESDAADVFQATWLRLLEHIDRLEHPDRVGSWLAATARHECLRSIVAGKRILLADDDVTLKERAVDEPEIDERLLLEERVQAVREAVSHLPWRWQRLVEMLMADPPVSYAEISDELGLPVGSIGPMRSRCLAALRALVDAS